MKAKKKILVVDDDANLRKTLADILKLKGYEAVVASTGTEAFSALERESFSLALIDLMLPDMSGLDVMARIKVVSPLTEAIILTGHASMDTAIEATKQGAYSYLLKPYQMDELLRQIAHGVERHHSQEEILRLASFPRLNPSPVIELAAEGEVTYLNPAAENLFPDLKAMGMSHPLLAGTNNLIATLRQGGRLEEVIHEITLGEAIYELHISYIQDVNLIRIYVMDITQRKRAEEEIHILATTDSLTGIANRREFSVILAREVERARRYGSAMSLAMYDLDFFKRVNDSFGHDAGDYVLQAVTELVQSNIRATDVVARWGGEEFMLLMPQTELDAANLVAEKLRQAIAVDKLTASFGVTAFREGDDLNSLLKRVDDALYQAKKNGRNRVEILEGEIALK